MIELTSAELFKDLTFIQNLEKGYDLHNDYKCSSIYFDNLELTLGISFSPIEQNSGQIKDVRIVFDGVIISKFDLFLSRVGDSATLNIFYRGRFEKSGEAHEFAENGDAYFYIEFEAGDRFEFFARSVFLQEDNS